MVTSSGVSGDIVWSAATARSGALLCDGSTYDGTNPTYAALYAAIGTTFGGSGVAAFKVPDLRDRVVVGAGGNTALAANDGVAAANRQGTRHRHTPHTHAATFSWNDTGAAGTANYPVSATAPTQDHTASAPLSVPSVDGGSGTSSDPLDGAAYMGLNAFILL